MDAYGDMEEDEIPDSYVKLHMDVAGRTDDKQTEVVNDDMTPSVRTTRRPPAGNGNSSWQLLLAIALEVGVDVH